MLYDKIDPEKIIEELKRIIERLERERRIAIRTHEEKLSNPS